MDRYPAHKLASLCQRMPLDVYVYVDRSNQDLTDLPVRVVKSEFVTALREMDGRTHIAAKLTLEGIYTQF
jgi:hypothetical protein